MIRFLGADPAVYHPIARAQSRILSRRTRLRRGRPGLLRGLTPFQVQCVTVSLVSLYLLGWLIGAPAPLVGVVFTLTAGAGLLLVDLLFDKFDVLADPDEYQVIAAHPHDTWSVVLAKAMAIGRGAAILAACAFTAPAIAVGFVFHSAVATGAYVLAAAALTVAVSAGGMLASAAVLALGGRTALQRVLPVVHLIYLALYLGIMTGRRMIMRLSPSGIDALGWLKWALPPVWFAAPVELAVQRVGPTTLARGALALGSFVLLVPLSARWLRSRFDERILEPLVRRARPGIARKAARIQRSHAPWQLGPRVFLSILRAHIRSDVSVRGGMMAALFMPVLMLVSTQASSPEVRSHGEYAISMLTIGIASAMSLLNRMLQMSSRPQALWFVLISPEARLAYSRSAIWFVRLAVLLPLTIVAAIYVVLTGSGSLLARMLFVVLAAILCDTILVANRGVSSALPFSRPVKAKDRMRWGSLIGFFVMMVLIGIFFVGFILLVRINPWIGLIPIASAILLRAGLGWWAGMRVRRSAWEAEGV